MEDRNDISSDPDERSWALLLLTPATADARPPLLDRYWSAVYAFLRRRGERRDDAVNLAGTFLATVVADRPRLECAGAPRDRLRTFLKRALADSSMDDLRHAAAPGAAASPPLGPDLRVQLDAAEPEPGTAPDDAFDRQWASATLNAAVSRLEDRCRREALEGSWEIFRELVLDRVLEGTRPERAHAFGESVVSDADHRWPTLERVNHQCRALLREVVAETIADPQDLEDELQAVQSSLE